MHVWSPIMNLGMALAIGVVIGVATDNLGLWLAIALVFGGGAEATSHKNRS